MKRSASLEKSKTFSELYNPHHFTPEVQKKLRNGFLFLIASFILMMFLTEKLPDDVLTRLSEYHLDVFIYCFNVVPLKNQTLSSFVEASTLPYEVVLFVLSMHCWIHFYFVVYMSYHYSSCLLLNDQHSSHEKDSITRKLQLNLSGALSFIVFALEYILYFRGKTSDDWRGTGKALGGYFDQFAISALDSMSFFKLWSCLFFEVFLTFNFILIIALILHFYRSAFQGNRRHF